MEVDTNTFLIGAFLNVFIKRCFVVSAFLSLALLAIHRSRMDRMFIAPFTQDHTLIQYGSHVYGTIRSE
jgi:hypothetical protein